MFLSQYSAFKLGVSKTKKVNSVAAPLTVDVEAAVDAAVDVAAAPLAAVDELVLVVAGAPHAASTAPPVPIPSICSICRRVIVGLVTGILLDNNL
jgi:hypothetical protein